MSEKAGKNIMLKQLLLYTGVVLFAILAMIMLAERNGHYLIAIQDNSLFLKGITFYNEKASVPGGILQWAGCYLTQFFIYPWLGTSILVLLWIILSYTICRVFELKRGWIYISLIPISALLCSITDLGYWIYYMKKPGYCFAETIGLTLTMLMILCITNLSYKSKWTTLAVTIICVIVSYITLGWWTLVLVAMILCFKNISFIIKICAIITIAITPLIYYQNSTHIRLEDAWNFGFPIFQYGGYTDILLSTPFFVIIIFCVAITLISQLTNIFKNNNGNIIAIITFISCCFIIWKSEYNDKNFHNEIKMCKCIEECNWEKALAIYDETEEKPTEVMILCRNIALINTGQIGEKAFVNPRNIQIANSRGLNVSTAVIAGPLLYYYHGIINFSYRWCIENSVKRGLTVKLLKMMINCSILTEENDVAKKYLTLLNATTFYKKWASDKFSCMNDFAKLNSSKEFNAVASLITPEENILDGDNGMIYEFIITHFAYLEKTANILQEEVATCYSMLLKDEELIKFHLQNYYEIYQPQHIPTHLLEAVDIMNTNHSIKYQQFMADYKSTLGTHKKITELGKELWPKYKDSYWWYYYFFTEQLNQ